MKRYFLLALTAVPVVIAFGTGCKKTVPTVEAGTDIPVAAVEDAAMPVAEVDAGPAVPLATVAHTAAPVKSAAPAVGVYQGSYTCFNGMTVTQSGNTVSARQNPAKTDNYATVACTAAGDTCDGATTIFVGGKLSGTKKSSLKRNPTSGDLTYKAENEAPAICHKNK